MNYETIYKISWWIPFKRIRENFREYVLISSGYHVYDINLVSDISKSFNSDKNSLDKYNKLINNLDKDSLNINNNIVNILRNFNGKIDIKKEEINNIFSFQKDHRKKIKKINNNLFIYNKKYKLNRGFFEFPNFYDKMWMDHINNIDFIKDKSIIDAGGFIGDTALIFSDYTNDNVYSFEPILSNINLMKDNIKLNDKNNIIPIYMALGDEDKKIYLDDFNSGDMLSKNNDISKNNKIEVQMTTLDSFVKEHNIKVGLIKTDLEGFEQAFLKGALNTIKEQKPILIISIYHNYSDFFEIKPMIEDLNLGYKFKILKSKDFNIVAETKLIAEVY